MHDKPDMVYVRGKDEKDNKVTELKKWLWEIHVVEVGYCRDSRWEAKVQRRNSGHIGTWWQPCGRQDGRRYTCT